jgi:hypothetical protein
MSINVMREVRNCNAGNVDYNPASQRQGQFQPDPAIVGQFARIDTAENGI